MVEFFEGRLGEPPGGFPQKLQKRVLRDRKPMVGRPGASMAPADFAATRADLEKLIGRPVNDREVVTQLLYPRVFPEYALQEAKYSDLSVLPTPAFFYGMEAGEEISIARHLNLDFVTHLPHDHFKVFVVNWNTLRLVHFLNLFNNVLLRR